MKCLDFNKAMLYICKVKQLKKLCNANFNESHLLRLLGPVQFLERQARRQLSALHSWQMHHGTYLQGY